MRAPLDSNYVIAKLIAAKKIERDIGSGAAFGNFCI